MKRALAGAIIVLILTSSAPAQEAKPVAVKGHTLGESVAQFVKAIGYDLAECPQILKVTPKEAKKQKIQDVISAKRSACAGFADAQNGRPLTVFMDYGDNLKPRLKFRSDTTNAGEFADWAAVFESQKLVEYRVKPAPETYTFDDIVAEIVTKYGKPANTKNEIVQNAYGGQMRLAADAWVLTDGTVIVANEDMVHTDAGYTKAITVSYFTKERWNELTNRKKPNALD